MQERKGVVTFKGNPLTLVGSEIRPGMKAPEFQVLGNDLSTYTLDHSRGKIRLISAVPSLDTPVCDQQTRRFNEEAARLPLDVEIITISMDLPFAQKRFCSVAGIERVRCFSDHRDASFGIAYGVLIKELRLLARSVFVIDRDGVVRYAEYVPEITNHPDYERPLQVIKGLL